MTTALGNDSSYPKLFITCWDAMQVNFDVNPDGVNSLIGSFVEWHVYSQKHGIITNTPPIFSKVLDNGLEIDDPTLLEVSRESSGSRYCKPLRKFQTLGEDLLLGAIRLLVVDGIMTVTEGK